MARNFDPTANLGFEAKRWLAADKLCNNMDAVEYKHVFLGQIFLTYISNTFAEKMLHFVADLESQFKASAKLKSTIRANLKGLGYAI